jgi:predicted MPP superfamily phosphohydrolase
VDGQINSLSGLAEDLGGIKPRFGKFAVMGNHEYYAGFEHSLNFIEAAGFTVLRGETFSIPGVITIVGMDDPAGKQFGMYRAVKENILLAGLPHGTFTLLLKHLPIVRPEAVQLLDLQLSGHTHKGQIFPFVLVVRAFFPNIAGWYDLGAHAGLYVSRGTGTWGPPMRFFAPPEITVIDLVHGPEKN